MLPAAQITLNIVVTAAIYTLVGISFLIPFRTARFFHFAHGAVFAAGPYIALVFAAIMGLPIVLASIVAIACAGCVGCIVELLIYRPLRRRGTSALMLLLASLGVYVVLQNAISMAFGDSALSVNPHFGNESMNVLGARLTPVQCATILAAVVCFLCLSGMLRFSRLGLDIRAVTSDPELARVSGINSDRVVLVSFAIGSAIVAFAGILVALDVGMTPTMGLSALLMGIIVVVVGGTRRLAGLMIGAFVLATGQHLAAWFIHAKWQDGISFVILVVFLLVRPQGLFGRRSVKEAV